ncbi:MAG: ABC transporter substrate-binding protein [Deltaproteobacteria bacterium]|nr:ABC transporter substrate-binding protein [Deltaproteobacteria bacterium]
MKMRRVLMVSAVIAMALALCAGPGLAQEKVIKIGALYPLTGNLAATGMDCKRGVDLAVQIINGKYDLNLPFAKTEGIPDMGGAKLQIIYADTQGDPKNGLAEAERLITQEKCVALIGAYQSAVTKTASQAAERLKIPYVCSDSSSPTLTERGFKYFFRVSPHDGTMARNQFEFLKDLEKKTGQKVETIGLVYENTEFGANVGKQEKEYAKEFGYKVTADIAYPANSSDVSSEVGKLMAAKPDVIMHAAYITDAILFTKTFKDMNVVPKGFLNMAGYIESDYLPSVKADGDFILVRSTFALDLAKKKPLVGQVADLYKEKYKIEMGENTARSFAAPFVLADAISRAKSTAPEAIVKALEQTDIPGDQMIYPWQGIKFDPTTHQNIYAKAMLVQIQDQHYYTVWPWEAASRELVWPFPAWKDRK